MTIVEALTPVMARAIERLYYRDPLMTRTHCRSCGDETDDGEQCWVCATDGRPIPAPVVEPVVSDADWDAYHRDYLDSPCGPSDDDRRLAEEHDELAIILGEYDPVEDCLEALR